MFSNILVVNNGMDFGRFPWGFLQLSPNISWYNKLRKCVSYRNYAVVRFVITCNRNHAVVFFVVTCNRSRTVITKRKLFYEVYHMYVAKCEKTVECLLSSMRFIASYML